MCLVCEIQVIPVWVLWSNPEHRPKLWRGQAEFLRVDLFSRSARQVQWDAPWESHSVPAWPLSSTVTLCNPDVSVPHFLVYENKGTGPGDLRWLTFHWETPLMGGEWTRLQVSVLLLVCFTYWVSRRAVLERKGSEVSKCFHFWISGWICMVSVTYKA